MTRFRAYRLDTIGDSFSYFDGRKFTLIEARYNGVSRPNVLSELKICGRSYIDLLHITSWDNDHCSLEELNSILTELKPSKIEYPGYTPHTDSGKMCLKAILAYKTTGRTRAIKQPSKTDGVPVSTRSTPVEVEKIKITPSYIDGLNTASEMTRRNIFYWPKVVDDSSPNDSSTVKLFRTGDFNVLSTGDIEKVEIATRFARQKIFKEEIDVLILAHHGAANGFTSSSLLDAMRPRIAVCGADTDNQFGHPKPEIRALLSRKKIELCTTKRGDVLIKTYGGSVTVYDLLADNTEVQKTIKFKPKKAKLEAMPKYALKDHYQPKPKKPFRGGNR